MTMRQVIESAIKTLQAVLTIPPHSMDPNIHTELDAQLPEEYMGVEVQVPLEAHCDAIAYIEVTEECDKDEDHPDGYKVSLHKF